MGVRDFLPPGEPIGEGDSYVQHALLPAELASVAFDNLKREVQWQTMLHRGHEVPRLVAVEGAVHEDGSYPIYRHPADESPPLRPFSATVARIRQHVEDLLHEPVNHVLIQHYRTGADYISEHSDKTIDILRGSKIVNVSLGAERFMTLRTKKDAQANSAATASASPPPQETDGVASSRAAQRVRLPHNSIFVMGLATNARWLHSIRTDKRPAAVKTAAERAYGGERISLTFRTIGTFLSADETRIWGQGARGKTRETAGHVVRGGKEGWELLQAFGAENHQSEFDWERHYGQGSDVLHLSARAGAEANGKRGQRKV